MYQTETAKRLIEAAVDTGIVVVSPADEDLQTITWQLALNSRVRTRTMESQPHAVERLTSQDRGTSAQFIPVRFIPHNKLTKYDQLLVVFDALVLSDVHLQNPSMTISSFLASAKRASIPGWIS